MTTSTANGSYTALNEIDASRLLAKDVDSYYKGLQGEGEVSRGLVPGISTAATMVSAFCGVMGLRGGDSGPGDLEIEIINNTGYPVVPASVYSQDFGFQEAARLMPSGESTSLKGSTAEGFSHNTSYILIEFVIGNRSDKCINLILKVFCGNEGRWAITEYTIDDKPDCFVAQDDKTEQLQYLAFYGKDPSWPSFSVNLQALRAESGGKMHLIFYPTAQ